MPETLDRGPPHYGRLDLLSSSLGVEPEFCAAPPPAAWTQEIRRHLTSRDGAFFVPSLDDLTRRKSYWPKRYWALPRPKDVAPRCRLRPQPDRSVLPLASSAVTCLLRARCDRGQMVVRNCRSAPIRVTVAWQGPATTRHITQLARKRVKDAVMGLSANRARFACLSA